MPAVDFDVVNAGVLYQLTTNPHCGPSFQPQSLGSIDSPATVFTDLIAQKQGRYGTPDEIASAAAFFASDQSGFCTGSSLVLDGGFVSSLV
ncbi:MAG: SDR family oxidoreductase [Mycobacterium sp.]|nr:SDR family oxidoreductase [Mycobacterium sp.]MBV8293104.1 SDR family oxidoreductase [Mycobacterium sp.]